MKIRVFKFVALFLAINLLAQVLFPTVAFALTGGPSQPEVQSFEPIGTSEMVDLFSGDFVYNIPLMNVGSYPINISHHSGATLDQESSWVGLGWNINPGVINRNMRGIPDDFKGIGPNGDFVKKSYNIRPNKTYGLTATISPELFGAEKFNGSGKQNISLSFGLGINYNNYKGFGMETILNAGISSGNSSKGESNASLGLGITSSSSEGLTVSPSLSFDAYGKNKDKQDRNLCTRVGSSFNSRAGLTALTIDFSSSSRSLKKAEGNISFAGGSGGSSISFASPTYITASNMPMRNRSTTLSVKWGGTFMGAHATFNVTGYYSDQKLSKSSENFPAFGFFNAELARKSYRAMQDFNREKDVAFTKNTPSLPVTNFTYDVYSVSGQGIGGMYRPMRSDVGYVYDSEGVNGSDSYSLGLELAPGNLVKVGLDPKITNSTTTTDKWSSNNELAAKLRFSGKKTTDAYFEPFYFKQAGEKSVDSEYDLSNSFFSKVGGFSAVRPVLEKSGGLEVKVKSELSKAEGGSVSVGGPIERVRRQKRNENISFLSVKEAKNFAISRNYFNTSDPNHISSRAKDHHIGEITSLNARGERYVYGIPAYNNYQKEVTFATGASVEKPFGKSVDNAGLVDFDNEDNSTSNQRGLDNYYSSTELPAYAHSYLLTSVLSTDYVDNDGTYGPSEGDMGNYTKFNYNKINSFKWRTPYSKANANPMLYTDAFDDQANFVYGEKELWYISSIEDKNYIAIFETGDREDGLGVQGESGGKDENTRLKYLKSIKLYSKADLVNPIKSVFFEYDYSLCPGVENNTGNAIDKSGKLSNESGYDGTNVNAAQGKLTLKKIYFTYKDSKRAKFSPYEFTYSNNHPFKNKAYDRWGNYKNYTTSYREVSDFPYTSQNKTESDSYAGAWSLTKIALPSGGEINIAYEADDYAFVQDKRAMQMFSIVGTAQEQNDEPDPNCPLYDNNRDPYDYIVVQINPGFTIEKFKEKYTKEITDLYFKALVELGEGEIEKDYVSGYAQFDPDNFKINSNNQVYIKLNRVNIGDKGNGAAINPIAKAALQFCKLYRPRLTYNQSDITDGAVDQVLMAMFNNGISKNLLEMAAGMNRIMMERKLCKKIIANKSYVRLVNPDRKKIGGGSRVKSIQINDNFSSMNGNDGKIISNTYGQKYTYTTKDPITKEEGISSGVAAYEPLLGGDENPFRVPVPYGKKQEKLLVPDDRFYMEEPFGESFFPGPSVGYSRVKVESINAGVRKSNGYTVNEFYTAYDFPTIVDRTDLQVIPRKSPAVFRLLKLQNKDYVNASQGYVIELNDMHGKPKASWVYAEGQDTYISGIEYKYKSEGKRLKNDCQIISPEGKINTATIGVDFDFVMDMREQATDIESVGLNGNLATFMVAIFPGLVPLILPAYAAEHTRFRSAVATKVVNRYGILEETLAYDLGSKISTKNLAWDGMTGEVLTTQIQNSFDDPIYNFTFPAHWAYNNMGPAFQNIGVEQTLELIGGEGTIGEDGNVTENESVDTYISYDPYTIGDEVIVTYNQFQDDEPFNEDVKYRFYVVEKEGKEVLLMGGKPTSGCKSMLTGVTKVKIIRSGRRNMSNVPVGTITCLKNPLRNETNTDYKEKVDFGSFNHRVLSAASTEFDDEWSAFCNCGVEPGNYFNWIFYGVKGNWRAKKTYAYLTGREKSDVESNLRKDGPFTSFSSFWTLPLPGENRWRENYTNWQWASEITMYDPYAGNEIENKDPLQRYSNAANSYKHQVPVSVSSNAKYSDIFNDNFEDYDRRSCAESLSNFNGATPAGSNSHTGRKSMKVPKNGSNATLTILPGCR